MTTPRFILDLRENIGHAPLWLSGITAFVQRDDGKVLLGRRADTHEWALIYGIVEPGENPADTAIREVNEETEVDCVPDYLAALVADDRMLRYSNGDRAQYLNAIYVCHLADGARNTPTTGDHENTDSGWFNLDDLPQPIARSTIERLGYIRHFLARKDHAAIFVWNGQELPAVR
ncbi:MAG: NUDIX domain-containing protein [Aeriscardovia sp.]|nr:NUDIX domain-containing protein [Aeriscardovia sp.]